MNQSSTPHAPPGSTPAPSDASDEIAEVLRSYDDTYARRSRQNAAGLVFRSPEPSAMLGVYLGQRGALGGSAGQLTKAAERLASATGSLVDGSGPHAIPVDIAGFAWAEAYGVLGMERPPIDELERVLESGMARGAVSGVFGSAWRLLFLGSALPLLNWQQRGRAVSQIERWIGYLESKVQGLASSHEVSGPPGISQGARLGFVLGQVADRFDNTAVLAVARELVGVVASKAEQDATLDAAVVAQVTAAVQIAGDADPAAQWIYRLINRRVDQDTGLIVGGDPASPRLELSPWVPIALVGACARRERPKIAGPRSLRQVLAELRGR